MEKISYDRKFSYETEDDRSLSSWSENSTHENSTHENSTHENSTQRKFHPAKIRLG